MFAGPDIFCLCFVGELCVGVCEIMFRLKIDEGLLDQN